MSRQFSKQESAALAKRLRDAFLKQSKLTYRDHVLELLDLAICAAKREQWNAVDQHAGLAAKWAADALADKRERKGPA